MDIHPESRLPKIERRFGTVTGLDRPNRRKRFYRALTFLAVTTIFGSAVVWYFSASPWSLVQTLKHFAAFPSCRAAEAIGLAPALRGQPGYWPKHDADNNGVACEPAGWHSPQKPSGKWVVPPKELKNSPEQQTQDSNRRAIVSSARITSDVVRVIDGDTIRIGHQKPDIRLVGFNAPETRRAQCEAERHLGDRATARLRDLVRSSKLDFEFVACSCPPGTEGTPACNFGRRCGTLKADGQDVGLILIRENLAVPFVCGQTRCPPTLKPWCN
jgi:endonuclease YncB( thermonuclease family)